MKLLPVVARELGSIARRPSAYWLRSGAAVAAFIAMGYVALVGSQGTRALDLGRNLFEILSAGAFAYCLVAGIRGTADALSEEKREGTLGLLFLTDLKGYDVVFGKFVSLGINSVYGVLAVVPVLALAMMLGGTSGRQFLMMAGCLFNTLFFSLAAGIFVSTFSQQERPAMSGALGIIFAACAGPYVAAVAHAYESLEIWEVMTNEFLLTSPIFAYRTASDPALARIHFDDFLLSLAYLHLAGWLCLVVASASIAQRAHQDAPRGRFVTWFLRLRQELAYGKAARRRALRGTLLDRNAFSWLAGRDRLKGRYAWAFLAMLGALWWFARWKAPEVMADWPVTLGAIWFVHLFFKIWLASEVASRFIEDRRSNALELLLTTPIRLREFASGQRLALARQFGGPVLLIFALNALAGWNSRFSFGYAIQTERPWLFFLGGFVHLLADFYAIHWVAIWRSMHLRGTNRAISQVILLVVLIPSAGWFLVLHGSWMYALTSGRPSPSLSVLFWIWTALCVAYNVLLAHIARRAFLRDFRAIASQAFERPSAGGTRLGRKGKGVVEPRPQPSSPMASMRRPVIACVLVGGLLYGAASWRRRQMDSELAARLDKIWASGQPVAAHQIPKWKPSPDPSQSAGELLRAFQRKVVSRPGVTLRNDLLWNPAEEPPALSIQRMTRFVATNGPAFQLLEQLPGRAASGPANPNLPQHPLRHEIFADALGARALLEMNGRSTNAAASINLILHVARALETEGIEGLNAARQALSTATALMQRGANMEVFTPADWRLWKASLEGLRPVPALVDTLIVDRIFGLEAYQYPPDVIWHRHGRWVTGISWVFTASWSMRQVIGQDRVDQMDYLELMEAAISRAQKPFWESAGARGPARPRQAGLTSKSLIAPVLVPPVEWLFGVATGIEATRLVLQSAADVEIHRLTHGTLPENLAAAGSPPRRDPYSGEPLRYAIRPDGYSIISVSEGMQGHTGIRRLGNRYGEIAFFRGPPPARSKAAAPTP